VPLAQYWCMLFFFSLSSSNSTKIVHCSVDMHARQLYPMQPSRRCPNSLQTLRMSIFMAALLQHRSPNSASTDTALNRPSPDAAHWRRNWHDI
jgi:hypothetical protein